MKLEGRACPNCGSPEINDQLKCEHCGVTCRWTPDGKTLILAGVTLICPSCGMASPPKARACGQCGASLKFTCPICQGEHPVGTRFCTEHAGESIEEAYRAIEGAKRAQEKAKKADEEDFGARHRAALEGVRFVQVPPGRFVMGSPIGGWFSKGEDGRGSDEVQHEVVLTRGFLLAEAPVTQAECNYFTPGFERAITWPENPVYTVDWLEAVLCCNTLSRTQGLEAAYLVDGNRVRWKGLLCPGYRLPTEAEWEYACRAGTTGARYGNLDGIAWHCRNCENQAHPVRQKAPNAWGLYDMLGSVREWCWDWYGAYPQGAVIDPVGPESGSKRVHRGGSWGSGAWEVRAAWRDSGCPTSNHGNVGFRLARSLP